MSSTRFDIGAKTISFERFPFFTGPLTRDAPPQPSSLPFTLQVDSRYAVIGLTVTPSIETALDRAYGAGSMLSTPLGHSSASQARLEEMLAGVAARFGGDLDGRSILEIGCGTGNLLRTLRDRGADVVGCEIGPQAEEASRRHGIDVIQEPLRAGLLQKKFDAVISYGCLEHILNLDDLFEGIRSHLRAGGVIYHSVPNSSLGFERGDVGHLAHQHVHYFTAENITRLVRAQGFCDVGAATTTAGNELHVWGRLDPAIASTWPGDDGDAVRREASVLATAARALHTCLNRQIEHIRALLDAGSRVGLYAGGHSLAWLGGFADRLRFYDGDPFNEGRHWLPGLPAIGSPQSLVDDPDDVVIVCASHHFPAIRDGLNKLGLPKHLLLQPLSDI